MSSYQWVLNLTGHHIWIISLGVIGVLVSVAQASMTDRVTVSYRVRERGQEREREVLVDFHLSDLRPVPPPNMPINRVVEVDPPYQTGRDPRIGNERARKAYPSF